MALKLNSADIPALLRSGKLDANVTHSAYNALDSAVTLRVHSRLSEVLAAQNTPHARTSYSFVRAMQAPALDMMRRGIAVNAKVRQDETARFSALRDRAQALLDTLADAIWGPEHYVERLRVREMWTPMGKRGQPLQPRLRSVIHDIPRTRKRGLNAGSSAQCLAFFNTALRFPIEYEIRKTPEGRTRTPTANDKALRKWAKARVKGPGIDARDRSFLPIHLAQPFVSLILSIRDADKMLGVLRTPLDPDGRMRCSYNVVGTESGRWSSSKNAFGRGTNLQNITPTMRRMFCADDGCWLVSPDLEQAESRVVGGLVWATTGDDTYLNACNGADLHTTVCTMAWPERPWTDDLKANRALAEERYPALPQYSYRDVAKRIGHGSNYRGSPFGIAQAVGIPSYIVEEFQHRYFRAFPAIPAWHSHIKAELQNNQYLDTPLLRRRYFFSRPTEDTTLREAIAFIPQSTVAELLNLIMYKCWARSILPRDHPSHLPIQLLLQNHDAFAFQTPLSEDLANVISQVNHEFRTTSIPLSRGAQQLDLTIPGEFVTGFNWAYADKDPTSSTRAFADGNPDGLRKWSGSDHRKRQQGAAPQLGDWLNRPLARVF